MTPQIAEIGKNSTIILDLLLVRRVVKLHLSRLCLFINECINKLFYHMIIKP